MKKFIGLTGTFMEKKAGSSQPGLDYSKMVEDTLFDIGYPLLNDHVCCNGVSPINGQVIAYNSTTKKLEFQTVAGVGGIANLALGVLTTTTIPITNSSGTGFTLPSANGTTAGLLSSNLFNAISTTIPTNFVYYGDGTNVPQGNADLTWDNTTKVFRINGKLDVSLGIDPTYVEFTPTATNTSIGVANNTIWIDSATNHLMRGSVDLETLGGGVSNLALGTVTATTQPITNSNGTGFTLPASTTTTAGLMTAADKTKSDFITITQAVDLDALETDVADLTTLSGVASNAQDLGTFTGTTIADNVTVKAALQALETEVETKQDILAFQDEGVATSVTPATTVNFVGGAIAATQVGTVLTVTSNAAAIGRVQQNDADIKYFINSGTPVVTFTKAGGVGTISVAGGTIELIRVQVDFTAIDLNADDFTLVAPTTQSGTFFQYPSVTKVNRQLGGAPTAGFEHVYSISDNPMVYAGGGTAGVDIEITVINISTMNTTGSFVYNF